MSRPITMSCAAAPKRQQSLPGPSLSERAAGAQGEESRRGTKDI